MRHGVKVAVLSMSLLAVSCSHDTASTEAAKSASSSSSSSTSELVPRTLEDIDWARVDYPVDCEDAGWRVWDVAYAEPADSHAVALVLVTCDAGAGTPSVELYAFDQAEAPSPHLSQTLVSATDNWQANKVELDADGVSLPVFGFSNVDVPRCCPDITATLTWRWNGTSYDPTNSGLAHDRS